MNGAPPLSNTLIAGMRPPQPAPQQPPMGGLNQAAGNAPMAKGATDSALMTINQENVVEPGLNTAANMGYQQYANDLMKRLMASLPSTEAIKRAQVARGLMLENVFEHLQPKERSGMDLMTAGITSYDKPIMYGQEGAALATMGRGAAAAKKQYEDEEQKKAMTAYSLVDKEMDQQQKLMADAITKGSKLQQSATGKWIPSPKEPGVFINNVSGERRVISNADALAIRELAGRAMASGKYDSAQEAMDAALQLHYNMMPQGAAAPGQAPAGMVPPRTSGGVPVPPPVASTLPVAPPAAPITAPLPPLAAAAQPPQAAPELTRPAASTPPSTQAAPVPRGYTGEAEVGSIEGFELLRSMMNQASRDGDREKFEALRREMVKSYPTGRPKPTPSQILSGETTAPAWPKTSAQKAEEKSVGEFTVTPQQAVLQGVPYIPNIYDKFTDPKRREEAAKDFQKQWQDWQEKKMPNFQAAGDVEQGLKRFLQLQQVNKGTDAGVYDVLPFVTDIRARMNPSLQEMQTIANKQALSLREAGSGAMSDKDLAIFRQSTIGVDKLPEANEDIAKAQLAGVQRIKDYKRFASKMYEVYRFVDPARIESLWNDYTEANPIYGGTDKKTGRIIINQPISFERWFNQNRKDKE